MYEQFTQTFRISNRLLDRPDCFQYTSSYVALQKYSPSDPCLYSARYPFFHLAPGQCGLENEKMWPSTKTLENKKMWCSRLIKHGPEVSLESTMVMPFRSRDIWSRKIVVQTGIRTARVVPCSLRFYNTYVHSFTVVVVGNPPVALFW